MERPRNPARKEPARPRIMATTQPPGSLPGMISFAMTPAMRPMRMVPIIFYCCGVFVSGSALRFPVKNFAGLMPCRWPGSLAAHSFYYHHPLPGKMHASVSMATRRSQGVPGLPGRSPPGPTACRRFEQLPTLVVMKPPRLIALIFGFLLCHLTPCRGETQDLRGKWKIVSMPDGWKKLPGVDVLVADDQIQIRCGAVVTSKMRFTANASRGTINVVKEGERTGEVQRAVYRISGDTITISVGMPTGFWRLMLE